MSFVRRHQMFIAGAAIVALIAYALVIAFASRETAITVGTGYLVVLMTIVVIDTFAHRNQGPRT